MATSFLGTSIRAPVAAGKVSCRAAPTPSPAPAPPSCGAMRAFVASERAARPRAPPPALPGARNGQASGFSAAGPPRAPRPPPSRFREHFRGGERGFRFPEPLGRETWPSSAPPIAWDTPAVIAPGATPRAAEARAPLYRHWRRCLRALSSRGPLPRPPSGRDPGRQGAPAGPRLRPGLRTGPPAAF